MQWHDEEWDLRPGNGVVQGGSHSSTLFAYALDFWLSKLIDAWRTDCTQPSLHTLIAWLFVDDLIMRFTGWKQLADRFPLVVNHLLAAALHLYLRKTKLMAPQFMLRLAEGIELPVVRAVEWGSSVTYLRKPLVHAFSLSALESTESLIKAIMPSVWQAWKQMHGVCKGLSWVRPLTALAVLDKYVASTWLWLSPLLEPLQDPRRKIPNMQLSVSIEALRLFIPQHLPDETANAINSGCDAGLLKLSCLVILLTIGHVLGLFEGGVFSVISSVRAVMMFVSLPDRL